MKMHRWFLISALVVIVLAFVKIGGHINFWVLPVFFFVTGVVTACWDRVFSIYLFLFLFPFITASPGLFGSSYPYNYLAVPLFLLGGIVLTTVVKGIRCQGREAPEMSQHELPEGPNFYFYFLFAGLVLLSAVFVVLRWSNVTVPGVNALFSDTPVSPGNPYSPDIVRVSFASIFPVVTLFLYFVSPFIFYYVKRADIKEEIAFKWVSFGFYVSVGLAFFQKFSGRSAISDRLGKDLKQFYGGFSDFNAFGFFSGVMFLWSTFEIRKKNPLGYITFAVGLAGNILSGSRTTFFFIIAGIVNVLIGALKGKKKQQKLVAGGMVLVVVLLVIFAGGTLTKRLGEGFSEDKGFWDKLNAITNGRVWMTSFAFDTAARFPVCGVGTGNFISYLAHMNYLPYTRDGVKYTYDLPLNHYLFIVTENGIPAAFAFFLFMYGMYLRSTKKLLIGTILFSLLFNNFFWFPEAFLLFWVLLALNDRDTERSAKGRALKPQPWWKAGRNPVTTFVLIILIAGFVSVFQFNWLHPETLAQENGISYDYGLWYPEKDAQGREFHWTKGKAGIFTKLDLMGNSKDIRLFCGAQLAHFKNKKQVVEIFWKGKRFRRIIFKDNREEVFKIKGKPMEEGFLEIVVRPVYNPRRLGIGPETRDLGVQFFL